LSSREVIINKIFNIEVGADDLQISTETFKSSLEALKGPLVMEIKVDSDETFILCDCHMHKF